MERNATSTNSELCGCNPRFADYITKAEIRNFSQNRSELPASVLKFERLYSDSGLRYG